MREFVIDFFLGQPRRLIALGTLLARFGGFLLLMGAIGSAATTVVSAVRGMATRTRPDVAVAEVLPAILSWCVPETPIGFGVATLLVAAGAVAMHTGRAYQRMWRC